MQVTFLYGLFLLPAVMTLVALVVRWSSLAHPGLFVVAGFLAMLGLQAVVRWGVERSLHNFIPASAATAPTGDLPLSFLLSHYGLRALLLLVSGTALLVWLGNALSKA